MLRRQRLVLVVVVCSLCLSRNWVASAERIDYLRDVKPLLRARCYACHGPLKQEAGLRLDTGEYLLRGGDSGPVVKPGHPEQSPLLARLSAPDPNERMPPEGEAVPAAAQELIRKWIQEGAGSPPGESPAPDPRKHWSFQPPQRPTIPNLARPVGTNPIDVFVQAQLDRHQLSPLPEAAKPILLRRVWLDLVGLPPPREELQAFLADDSPAAYERVVDRLLASPAYGERWARHWMDVWRYSDWFGRRMVPDVWNSAPQIWRWRDWIVRSLNADRGYDQMVREMLAGDEVAPDDDEAGYATGYLIRNWYALNPNDWMRSNVEHTSKAFLGLTIHCAHCHDHKYDPISQDDYFGFRAFFEPIGIRQDRVPGEADPGPFQEYNYSTLRKIVRLGGVRIYDKSPQAPTWFYTGGDERNRVKERGAVAPGFLGFLKNPPPTITPVSLPATAQYPSLRPAIRETIWREHQARAAASAAKWEEASRASERDLGAGRDRISTAEKAWSAAREQARAERPPGALRGQQSLLLDAATGRILLQHPLHPLDAVPDGSVLSWELRLLRDAHWNLQLVQDADRGLTAGCVILEKGRILSYEPGTTTEVEVGRYDPQRLPLDFEFRWEFRGEDDRGYLTVVTLPERTALVQQRAVARNGWNPARHANQGIALDARTGSIVAVDELSWSRGGTSSRPFHFDFENPRFPLGCSPEGIDGWRGSTHSQYPGRATVVDVIGKENLVVAARSLAEARQAAELPALQLRSYAARKQADESELRSVQARFAADQARWAEPPAPDAESLAKAARQAVLAAAVQQAEAGLAEQEHAVAVARSKPLDDAGRKALEAADKQLAAARAALTKAREAISDTKTPATEYPPFGPSYPPSSTGRRKALAEWITARDNPLAARVGVNHIWMRHFHAPLVTSVFDFGVNGSPPSHPELLDWLAVEWMENGWRMKPLHRLIVTSAAYRRSSGSAHDLGTAASTDPENRWLWRMNRGRMESEVVRDSLLGVAGRLDLRIGGQELENSEAFTTHRRTMYYSCHPELDGKSALGALFDAPEPSDCYRRTRSVIPQQALALTNSELVHRLSADLTQALVSLVGNEAKVDPRAFVTAAFETILSRSPTAGELDTCLQYLNTTATAGEPMEPTRLRISLVRALLNHNDFLTIR